MKAVVVPEPGVDADEALASSILEHCRQRLATIKMPRSVDFTDEIPRSEAGKLLRRRLRDRYPS